MLRQRREDGIGNLSWRVQMSYFCYIARSTCRNISGNEEHERLSQVISFWRLISGFSSPSKIVMHTNYVHDQKGKSKFLKIDFIFFPILLQHAFVSGTGISDPVNRAEQNPPPDRCFFADDDLTRPARTKWPAPFPPARVCHPPTAAGARGNGCGLRSVARMMMARVATITLPPRIIASFTGPSHAGSCRSGNECSAGHNPGTSAAFQGEAGLKTHDVSVPMTAWTPRQPGSPGQPNSPAPVRCAIGSRESCSRSTRPIATCRWCGFGNKDTLGVRRGEVAISMPAA